MASWATPLEGMRQCLVMGSRDNPNSAHRKELRRLIRWHELDVIEAVLLVDEVAHLDPSLGPMDIQTLVKDARSILAPLMERTP